MFSVFDFVVIQIRWIIHWITLIITKKWHVSCIQNLILMTIFHQIKLLCSRKLMLLWLIYWWTHYLPKHCRANSNNTQKLMNWDAFQRHFTITCIWCSTATRFAICGAVLKLKFKLGGTKNNRLSINTLFMKDWECVCLLIRLCWFFFTSPPMSKSGLILIFK